MNPYEVPKSELIDAEREPPKSLPLIYVLLGASFIFAAIESTMLIGMESGNIFELNSHIFILLWLGVLVWVGNDIARRKNNPKWLMLFLSALIFGMAAIDDQGFPFELLSIAVFICYISIYLIIRKPEYLTWFSGKNA
ncbi:MAG: hypothetical protein GY696_28520 [Gammaproteobacteria bacterium]|nr:hypothetical protein [Gammaproteobacteria bacterium]